MSPTWIATLGWAFAEFTQSRRHKTVYCGAAGSYAQPSQFAARRRLGGIEERVEIANNVASLAVELSRSRKTDIAPVSHQQWTADLLLQTLDLLAQRGLGDM